MNRRRFLAGLGAALATVAATTRLGQSTLAIAGRTFPEGDFDTANLLYKCTERFSRCYVGGIGWLDEGQLAQLNVTQLARPRTYADTVVDVPAVRQVIRSRPGLNMDWR